jgi:hypothetical protein
MKTWRTELIPQKAEFQISLADAVFTIGSCFAQTMGNQLLSNKIKTQVNPFGTAYNPHCIHRLITRCLDKSPLEASGILNREGLFFHYDFHSQQSATTEEGLIKKLSKLHEDHSHNLKQANVLIITYGTAFVYRRKDNQQIVSNCHKVPASEFTKELLTVEEIIESFEKMHDALVNKNSTIKIILTVSPVRHAKDGLEQNTVSKSVLRLACHQLAERKGVVYFPAYELMMDDLRDYRFYKIDRIHPTEEAEEYIWEKFLETFLDAEAKVFFLEWSEVKLALQHRPFHEQSTAHQTFLKNTLSKLQKLSPKADVSSEILELKSRITHD